MVSFLFQKRVLDFKKNVLYFEKSAYFYVTRSHQDVEILKTIKHVEIVIKSPARMTSKIANALEKQSGEGKSIY